MSYLFPKIAVLGLGLLGGSLALELRAKKLAQAVHGYNRGLKNRRLALRRRACHQVFGQASEAVLEADLVVLATPVNRMLPLVKEIAPSLKQGALVTDLGSTKASLKQKIPGLLPKGVYFLGGHPMAGSHETGMAAARLGLFEDKLWFLCPRPQDNKKAPFKKLKKSLESLIKKLKAKALYLSAAQHDQILAQVSHLPQMLAYSLMHSQLNAAGKKALPYVGSGFLNTSRLAASSPEMWLAIAQENRPALLKALAQYQKSLNQLQKALSQGKDKSLKQYFEKASTARQAL